VFRLYNKKNVEVVFTTDVPGLIEDIKSHPQPTKNFYPSWWTNMPTTIVTSFNTLIKETALTAKTCPSFFQLFNEGYVIPAWCDMTFVYDKTTDQYAWQTGKTGSIFEMSTHSNFQFIDHANYLFQNKQASFIFKADSPWKIFTPKGYSCFQLPLFYHFNNDWTVLPGILNSDVFHNINIQIAYFGDKTEVYIKKGTPLTQYVILKRNKYKTIIRNSTSLDTYKVLSSINRVFSKKKGGYFNLLQESNFLK
jgi:hypothetical protein